MSAGSPYHHGNLRRALLDEALLVIAENGVGELSVRELASRLGVSHAAPYHHFADKTALLHALAFEGLREMDEAMAVAERAAGEDPVERLLGIGVAYATFVVEHPAYHAVWTSAEATGREPDTAEHEQPHGDTWGRLMRAVVACQAAGALPAGDPVLLGVHLWSLVSGFADLWVKGPLRELPHAGEGLGPFARRVFGVSLGLVTDEDVAATSARAATVAGDATATPGADAPWSHDRTEDPR